MKRCPYCEAGWPVKRWARYDGTGSWRTHQRGSFTFDNYELHYCANNSWISRHRLVAVFIGLYVAAVALVAFSLAAHAETGIASFYGGPAHHGQPMANGQIYDQESDSCAHKKLAFGTHLRVTRAGGGAVVCIVRDRGPFKPGRIVDLSVRHARALGMIDAGVVNVTAEPVR